MKVVILVFIVFLADILVMFCKYNPLYLEKKCTFTIRCLATDDKNVTITCVLIQLSVVRWHRCSSNLFPCHPVLRTKATQSFTVCTTFDPLKPELNPIYYLLALLGAHHFLHVSRIWIKLLTLRLLMSYIYGASILDVSRSHTTTQHSR